MTLEQDLMTREGSRELTNHKLQELTRSLLELEKRVYKVEKTKNKVIF